MSKPCICLWITLVLSSAAAASAQDPASAPNPVPPPHLSILEGAVVIDREGASEAAVVNAPVLDGDRIRTGEGRAEVLFPDGTALHFDRDTTIDLLAPDLFRLMQGRLYLAVAGHRHPSRAIRYQVDTPPASVQTDRPGEYRLELSTGASGGELSLAVVSGAATLVTEGGAVTARAGERVRGLTGERPIGPEYYNSARWDAFDRWSMDRRDDRRGVVSVSYLPEDLRPYAGTFDRYGTWRQEPDYGYVWYPSVSVDWRPYWEGYWRPYPAWDSFWISADPWGWPTHHYGRWGFSLSMGWYWIPDRSWGAAWVHWAVAPGYVSWCPLGFSNRPVFGLWGVSAHRYARPVDPWRGWTVVLRHHFGRPVHVAGVALDGRRLGSGAHATFMAQRAAPSHRQAVPRSRTAVPRGDSPLATAAPQRSFAGMTRGGAPAGPARGAGLTARNVEAAPQTRLRRDILASPLASAAGHAPPGRSSTGGSVVAGLSKGAQAAPAPGARSRVIPGPFGAADSGRTSRSPEYRSVPRQTPRESSPTARPIGQTGVRSRPDPSAPPSPGVSSAAPRSAPPRASAQPPRGAPPPSSGYNSGAATRRGNPAPRGSGSRRPPGREK